MPVKASKTIICVQIRLAVWWGKDSEKWQHSADLVGCDFLRERQLPNVVISWNLSPAELQAWSKCVAQGRRLGQDNSDNDKGKRERKEGRGSRERKGRRDTALGSMKLDIYFG